MLGAGLVFDRLMRRNAGGNEQNLIELKLPVSFLSADQMTDMGRIEGTAENADAHWGIEVDAEPGLGPSLRIGCGRRPRPDT